jgi:hypothetical protein
MICVQANEKLNALLPREQLAQDYNDKLKEKYQFAPEVRKISRHRVVPKQIEKARKMKHLIKGAKVRIIPTPLLSFSFPFFSRSPSTWPFLPSNARDP